MRLFAPLVSRARAAVAKALTGVRQGLGAGWLRITEPFSGAWQRNVIVDANLALSFHAVYACMTLIASDIAKLRVKLMQLQPSGVWTITTSGAFSPVLCKPNAYQTRIQFWEAWMLSKLMRGNAYILKQRDDRNVVVALHVLHPDRVMPLVADDGSVFYQVENDRLVGVHAAVIVPAREIVHDRMNCLFHPLVGVSPIFACGLAATQGLKIQNLSAKFFENAARPSGVLTAPGTIDQTTADRLTTQWKNNYSGEQVGHIAIAGDGLKYESMTMTSVDAQLVEQLKMTAEVVCSTFHVPPYKIGVGTLPSYNNVQSLNVEYYSQCLQVLIEAAEECLDQGLGIGWATDTSPGLGTEFDVDNLLRMDSVTQIASIKDGVSAGVLSPNEGRAKLDRPPVVGGETPYLQQQNYSLAALAKRDAKADPFGTPQPPQPALPPPAANDGEGDAGSARRNIANQLLIAARRHARRAAA